MFALLNLRVFFNLTAGTPFLDVCFPVEIDVRLADLIGEEILRKDPSLDSIVVERDIKSATSLSGKDAVRMLGLPASSFFAMCTGDQPVTLTVVIKKATPASSVKKKETGYQKMMKNSKPSYTGFKSKHNLLEVDSFLCGYAGAPSKEKYLCEYATVAKAKPSIKEQLEAYTVGYLNANKANICLDA